LVMNFWHRLPLGDASQSFSPVVSVLMSLN
jgi:hypothetical protein